jgi:hypothetical protein
MRQQGSRHSVAVRVREHRVSRRSVVAGAGKYGKLPVFGCTDVKDRSAADVSANVVVCRRSNQMWLRKCPRDKKRTHVYELSRSMAAV